jgi:hypothetical protein
MSPIPLQLPPLAEEDAIQLIIQFLRTPRRDHEQRHVGIREDGEPIFSIIDVIDVQLDQVRVAHTNANPRRGMVMYSHDHTTRTAPFYDAVWTLCRMGVLRPATLPTGVSTELVGTRFSVTPYGRQWLTDVSGLECIPTEYGRFAQLLASHAPRFGNGYHSRSQEALACYRAHTFLACCAMCGAAAESITLALAIALAGDEATVLTEYRRASGRSAIERRLMAGRNSHIQSTLPSFLSLLAYWRDDASHGDQSLIQEEQAFIALLLLLRFAQFADSRWEELATP